MKNKQKNLFTNLTQELVKDVIFAHKIHKYRQVRAYKNNDCTNWSYYCFFYLCALGKLVNELDEKDSIQNGIVVPTVFLFKHTIELVIKFVQVAIYKQVGDHDVDKIMDSLSYEKLLKGENLSKKIWLKKLMNKWKKTETQTENEVKLQFDKLKIIVENNFYNFFLSPSDEELSYIVVDKSNELFKYPVTNKVSIQVDPLSMIRLESASIESIKIDFRELNQIFQCFYELFSAAGMFDTYEEKKVTKIAD